MALYERPNRKSFSNIYAFIYKGFWKLLYVFIRIIISISAGIYIQIGVASRWQLQKRKEADQMFISDITEN